MVVQDYFKRQAYDRGEVSIDTLSFTLDLAALTDFTPFPWQLIASGLESPETNDNFFFWAAFQSLLAAIFGPHSLRLCQQFGNGRNFFRNSIQLENKAGFIAFGGNNRVTNRKGETEVRHERIQFYISGEGCRQVRDWNHVYQALTGTMRPYGPKLTRVDVAYDDTVGRRNLDHARDLYMHGKFKGRGAPPTANFIDDMGSRKGSTFNVGSRETGKMLRVYEKGRQLGDKASPWVRWELEVNAKQYEIPFDVLLEPVKYLAGAYPALEWISDAKAVIESKKKRAGIEFNHLVAHGRRGYGKLVHYMVADLNMTPDDVVSALIREGKPGRLIWTETEVRDELFQPEAAQTNPHLFDPSPAHWSADAKPQPVDALVIDWEEKRKKHWSNIR